MQAFVMHEAESPSTRATQKASNPIIDARRTAVEKGVVARTDVYSHFMRDMGKDAEAKREYDACCTGRVAKTEFRRAWAERKLEVVDTQMSQSQSLVKQEFSLGVHRGFSRIATEEGWDWKAAEHICRSCIAAGQYKLDHARNDAVQRPISTCSTAYPSFWVTTRSGSGEVDNSGAHGKSRLRHLPSTLCRICMYVVGEWQTLYRERHTYLCTCASKVLTVLLACVDVT